MPSLSGGYRVTRLCRVVRSLLGVQASGYAFGEDADLLSPSWPIYAAYQMAWFDGGADIAHQAALLAHGIAEGQHFLTASQAERFRWMVGLSGPGDPDTVVAEFAGWIRECLVPDTGP